MLVLTRREGESIILNTSDGPIEVMVTTTKTDHARIGIRAPKSVGIVRREVLEQKVAGADGQS